MNGGNKVDVDDDDACVVIDVDDDVVDDDRDWFNSSINISLLSAFNRLLSSIVVDHTYISRVNWRRVSDNISMSMIINKK